MITVRVPGSLHSELLEEAKKEGVSLNQLCLTKLARPLNWYRQRDHELRERSDSDGAPPEEATSPHHRSLRRPRKKSTEESDLGDPKGKDKGEINKA